jgi:two-component system, cell cycle response regulator
VTDSEEKTRVTVVKSPPGGSATAKRNDCLVVIYTQEATLLGKRFVLEGSTLRIGRGSDNNIVLDGDSVSRRHAHLERNGDEWRVVDDGSTNGTLLNDELVEGQAILSNEDRIKVGPTILKYLTGADVESLYHEEIYRMTIVDGLTQIHNKRYMHEALEREVIRARRHTRDLGFLMFDLDHFKMINDEHGHLAGDYVLKELARVVTTRIRRDEVFARYGGEEFAIILPETDLPGSTALAESIREKIEEHAFVFQSEQIKVTISVGVALLDESDKTSADLIRRADERLFDAKRGGRNRVCA